VGEGLSGGEGECYGDGDGVGHCDDILRVRVRVLLFAVCACYDDCDRERYGDGGRVMMRITVG
jgi:hypothetical protein